MTDHFDTFERDVGIRSYLTKEKGFAAVLKARFSDFIVHETNNYGEVAKLESVELPVAEKHGDQQKKNQESGKEGEPSNEKEDDNLKSKKRKCAENDDGVATSTDDPGKEGEPSAEIEGDDLKPKKRKRAEDYDEVTTATDQDEIWSQAKKHLTSWVGEDTAKNAVELIRGWEINPNIEGKGNKFAELPKVEEKEKRKAIHQWIRSSFSKYAVADTHEGQIRIWHKRFERDMPTFGKFDRIGKPRNERQKKKKWLEGTPDFLQFVLYKENIDTGVATKDILKHLRGKVRLGYAGMKDKRGVTTQFCTLYRRMPEELLTFNDRPIRSNCGGSTYGRVSVIRVGNFKYVDKEIMLGKLKGNRFDVVLRNVDVGKEIPEPKVHIEMVARKFQENGFINYFGMQRFGKDHDTHKVGIHVLKGDFKSAIDMIMRTKPNESPRTNIARKKWEKRFETLADTDQKTREKTEKQCANEVLKHMGRFMTCEVAILNCLKREPLKYRKAWTRIPRNIRSMFLHAVQSAVWNNVVTQRIESRGMNICEGDLVQVGNNGQNKNGIDVASGRQGKTVKALTKEDLKVGTFNLTNVVIPLVGSRVEYPKNETNKEIDDVLKGWGLEKKNFQHIDDREISLGGDYRKIICKPFDINYTISEYTDPLQPLLQTDLMKVNKEELKLSEEKDREKTLLALVIGFTLPPSSYATIALRELMKRPTSSEYQSQLQLEGDCEGRLSEYLEKK